MKLEAVLFDLFDTLLLIDGGEDFYSECLKKLHAFLKKNGVNVSFEEFQRVYFEVRDSIYADTSRNFEEPHFKVRVWQTLKKLGFNYELSDSIIAGAVEAFAEEFTRYVRLDEKASATLKKLHGKYKLGIVSNFAIPECAKSLLEKFQLKEYFDIITVSAEVNKRKPSPEIFRQALSSIEVDPSKAVFVGDTLDIDVDGAKKAGVKAIWLIREHFTGDHLARISKNIKPDKTIKSLDELLTIIEDC
ncbi:MAG: HAD family hydrolase [Candidatus Bathyarchaeia archaeon]